MAAPTPVPAALDAGPTAMRYGALTVMMCLSFVLVTAEFLPNGLLVEMAGDLGVTPGRAGQTVSVTALAGLIAAPAVGLVLPRLDRRTLLIWAAGAAALSNLVVALVPHFAVVLVARFLLGGAISAFWTMSITVAARLAPPGRIGRAVMFTTAGLSVATVAGVPLGVLLGGLLGWRSAFLIIGIATMLVGVAVRILLPSVPAAAASSIRMLVDTVRRPGVGTAMVGHVLVVLGHFVAYTYIRLALERGPGTGAGTVVVLLALFGAGGLIGNVVVGSIVDRAFRPVALGAPLLIAASIATVVLVPSVLAAAAVAVLLWGAAFAAWLIVINAWVGRSLPDRLEAGGSLTVTGFQLAIMIAAGLGGFLIDGIGVVPVDLGGVLLLLVGALLFGAAARPAAGSRSAGGA